MIGWFNDWLVKTQSLICSEAMLVLGKLTSMANSWCDFFHSQCHVELSCGRQLSSLVYIEVTLGRRNLFCGDILVANPPLIADLHKF